MLTLRVLLIATDEATMIAQSLHARRPQFTVVEVTTPQALVAAVQDGSYDAICLQYPLPWITTPSVIQLIAQWLPTCPLLVFAPQNHLHSIQRLVNVVIDKASMTIPVNAA